MTGKTLFGKVWDSHVVSDLGGDWALLHIDRHLLHDLSGSGGLEEVQGRGLAVSRPDLTFAVLSPQLSRLGAALLTI